MEHELLQNLAAVEETHWWFQGRRRIILSLAERVLGSAKRQRVILDVGAGSGRLAQDFSRWGEVHALEGSEGILPLLRARAGISVHSGFLPCEGLPPGGFDLVTAFDVLEHIEDDRKAMEQITALLGPQGVFIATVPAFQWLWSDHDELHHHYRRYEKTRLTRLIREAGLELLFVSHFQTLLFPAVALERFLRKLGFVRPRAGKLSVPPRLVNQALEALFSAEAVWLRRFGRFPIGSSLIVIARVPALTRQPTDAQEPRKGP